MYSSSGTTPIKSIDKRVLGEKIEVTIPGREKGFFAKLKRLFKKQ